MTEICGQLESRLAEFRIEVVHRVAENQSKRFMAAGRLRKPPAHNSRPQMATDCRSVPTLVACLTSWLVSNYTILVL